ncbi:DmsC/YnfH family molybdoenzyme membrane anchor subunit [Adlercreutzia sp. ZJ242]|uniref:dimethyl sulfoxide reductase anchor subunit family protein n=1 Tax=Adlercreutzia sp. ZJ242 TaxID=2709409 RepID=UPI0013ECDA0F|nr:DmsC/YnfH family molybdoenzyme membrane anchor subunit [Adlercreutzia sp. ZJ242]
MQIHWPLIVSTTCQRVGLGLFICAFLGFVCVGSPVGLSVVAWITLVLLAVGGIASVFHLQRPKRFFNAFKNPKSHLAQEAIVTPFLGVALLACGLDGVLYDLGEASLLAGAVAAALAAAFLVCTGLAYQMGSRPAWNTPFVLVLFLLTALSAGTIGVVVLWLVSVGLVPVVFVWAAVASTAVCVACQIAYVARMRSVGYGVNVEATKEPYRPYFIAWVVMGAAVPLTMLLSLLIIPLAPVISCVIAWLSCACGIAAWTMLFFRGAHKVKMFPMYPVDLNLDM